MDSIWKVSIVIPCYNEQQYIRACLNSLCEQTYENIEIICVDDGSTDETLEILKKYQKTDTRIKLFTQKNQYAGVARNYGMKLSQGDYICFLDADDIFGKDMIKEMLLSAVKNQSDIVLCNARFYNDVTKEVTEPQHVLKMDYLKDLNQVFSCDDIPEQILSVGFSVSWNKLYKKSFLERNGLFFQDIQRCNDEYFVGMSMALAERISYVNQRFVTYRINNRKSLQGYGEEKASYDFYMAYAALKEGLEQRGFFDKVKLNFINKVLAGCAALLEKQNYMESYVELYNFIKTVVFQEFGLDQISSDQLYTNKVFFDCLKKYSAEENLFIQVKNYQKSRGEKYLFPFDKLGTSREISLYAAGEVGRAYYRQILGNSYYNLSGWYDRNYQHLRARGIPISSPEMIKESKFEKLVIAVSDETIYLQIKENLIRSGVEKEKIL